MRRTREEAERTREAIVEAALACFDRHGIARSTLDQIAAAAKVTKGAIYHHFDGKRAILREIREQVTLPLMDAMDTSLLHDASMAPLDRLERFLAGTLESIERNPRKRRALGVMLFKCEYVDGLESELAGALRTNRRLRAAFESVYAEAVADGTLVRGLPPRIAAIETAMFLSGLMRLWLLEKAGSALRAEALQAIRAHVRSRRAR